MSGPPLITLTTDFGGGPFVGLMKGVILGIYPQVRLVDLCHDIPPQNVRAGALVLEQILGVFPSGSVHLVVVDPGVGTERRPVVVEALNMLFVGPDNGLFTPVMMADPGARIFSLNKPRYHRQPVSATFHGRDIFAPVAAHLARGVSPEELGTPVERADMLDWPRAQRRHNLLLGQILGADRFGNLQTNLNRWEVEAYLASRTAEVRLGELTIKGISQTYGQAQPGQALALFNSLDRLELALNRGDLARSPGMQTHELYGMEVRVAALG
jgi:S-adenosylmethionine hydrolase